MGAMAILRYELSTKVAIVRRYVDSSWECMDTLAQEDGANAHPPGRGVEIGLHAEDLEDDEQGKGVEIHLVDPAVDDEIAHDAEKDQCVDAGGRVGERYQGKAGPGCIRETAGGDQHKPPMELGPPAPVDGERKRNGEARPGPSTG